MHLYEIKVGTQSKHQCFDVLAPHSCKAVMLALDVLFPNLADDAPIPTGFSLTVKCRSPKK